MAVMAMIIATRPSIIGSRVVIGGILGMSRLDRRDLNGESICHLAREGMDPLVRSIAIKMLWSGVWGTLLERGGHKV